MRKILILIGIALPMLMAADDIFSEMPNVTMHQDSAIVRLINDKRDGNERKETRVQGYRVQVFSSNNAKTAKNAAFDVEKKLQEAGVQEPIYVQYNPPFWKVRVGDFREQADAKLYKDELITLLPNLVGDSYVVRDEIIVVSRETTEKE